RRKDVLNRPVHRLRHQNPSTFDGGGMPTCHRFPCGNKLLERKRSASFYSGPRYLHPAVHVSSTVTHDNNGTVEINFSQIHRAIFSPVGFSSPSMLLRYW